jgi:predicted transcriptional regulator
LKIEEIRKLIKQLHFLRATLYLSFLIGLGATLLTVALGLFQFSGPAVPSAQTMFANATVAATTTLYSATATTSEQVVAPKPFAPNYYGLTALISWTVFGAALIWRGHVRSVWGQSRFSYDTFRLLVKMRGAQTRLKLMRSLNPPKNKLQLATALGIDWKAIDKHVQLLEKNGLIKTASTNGTATYYEVTERGEGLLQVLEQLNAEADQPGQTSN